MSARILSVSIMTGVLLLFSGFALAADQERSQERLQTQEQIYGSQLMTKQERAEHREKLRAAKTEIQREQIRKEHHQRMLVRAKERGINLPDKPPAMGHHGRGMGPGGGGMGGGRGR